MTAPNLSTSVGSTLESFADRAAGRADGAIQATKQATNQALDSLQSGVESLRTAAPTALTRAAAQVDDLTRRGMERAREAGTQVRERAHAAGDRTVGYIREEPVKAMLIAAAAGAALAAVIGWASRSRGPRDY